MKKIHLQMAPDGQPGGSGTPATTVCKRVSAESTNRSSLVLYRLKDEKLREKSCP